MTLRTNSGNLGRIIRAITLTGLGILAAPSSFDVEGRNINGSSIDTYVGGGFQLIGSYSKTTTHPYAGQGIYEITMEDVLREVQSQYSPEKYQIIILPYSLNPDNNAKNQDKWTVLVKKIT